MESRNELKFPILECDWKDFKEREKWREKIKERIDNVSSEKDMDGREIQAILYGKFGKNGWLTKMERNIRSENEHPLDFVAGDPNKLVMYGFEVKGDRDTYKLLKEQINAYDETCHHIYLVIHKKEPPEWLPDGVGVIRVFENGDLHRERGAWGRKKFDISSTYD